MRCWEKAPTYIFYIISTSKAYQTHIINKIYGSQLRAVCTDLIHNFTLAERDLKIA